MLIDRMWTFKYKPQTFAEYIFTTEVVHQKVLDWIESKNVPSLLIYGPQGTGKTTLSGLLIKSLGLQDDFISINASNETGVDVIREKILSYAPQIPVSAKYKVIILDEADKLSDAAQCALKEIIERYEKVCRFWFITNNKNKIIAPLVSRCQELCINQMDRKAMTQRLMNIMANEHVTYQPEIVFAYINKFYPDFRKTLNEIQNNTIDNVVQPLPETTGYNVKLFQEVYDKFLNGRIKEARELIVNSFSNDDYAVNFYRFLMELIVEYPGITNSARYKILGIIRKGMIDQFVAADQEINISGTLALIINELS